MSKTGQLVRITTVKLEATDQLGTSFEGTLSTKGGIPISARESESTDNAVDVALIESDIESDRFYSIVLSKEQSLNSTPIGYSNNYLIYAYPKKESPFCNLCVDYIEYRSPYSSAYYMYRVAEKKVQGDKLTLTLSSTGRVKFNSLFMVDTINLLDFEESEILKIKIPKDYIYCTQDGVSKVMGSVGLTQFIAEDHCSGRTFDGLKWIDYKVE